MGKVISVGDIYGTLRKHEGLMEQISPIEEDTIIFLGDYIDRGPESYRTVEFLIEFADRFPNTATLRGNHEDFITSLFMDNTNEYERNI